MSGCAHPSVRGDNYGRTCNICGQVLAGYGEWAEGSKTCLHEWTPELDPNGKPTGNEICYYCERTRTAGEGG